MTRHLTLSATLALCVVGAAPAHAAPSGGETLFTQRCTMCHAVDPAPGKLGPHLRGVVGRKVATVPGFAYSDGMKKFTNVWTPANLDKYLSGPAAFVPGTRMVIAPLNAAQRAALIDYLTTLKKG